MTPPLAAPPCSDGDRALPSAGSLRLEVLRQRKDFLAAARASRIKMPGFILQVRARGDDAPARVGFTCSKKVGNAVARNRAKRRLREIARLGLGPVARAGHDYVFIGLAGVTANRPFAHMLADTKTAIDKAHRRKTT